MSVNITVHGSPPKSRRNLILNRENTKKELFEQRRKQRLQQVRLKSKEFAAQVRHNVNLEKQKQLEKIEKTKMKESNRWSQKAPTIVKDYAFGEAHRAAAIENQLNAERIRNEMLLHKEKSPLQNKLTNTAKNQNFINIPSRKITNSSQSCKYSQQKTNSNSSPKSKYKDSDKITIMSDSNARKTVTSHIYPQVEIIDKCGNDRKKYGLTGSSIEKYNITGCDSSDTETDKENELGADNIRISYLNQKQHSKSRKSEDENSCHLCKTPVVKHAFLKSTDDDSSCRCTKVTQNICVNPQKCVNCMCHHTNENFRSRIKDICTSILNNEDSESTLSSSDNAIAQNITSKIQKQKFTKNPSVILEIDSEGENECYEIEDSHHSTNRHFSRVNSNADKSNEGAMPPQNETTNKPKRFTQVSNFLNEQSNKVVTISNKTIQCRDAVVDTSDLNLQTNAQEESCAVTVTRRSPKKKLSPSKQCISKVNSNLTIKSNTIMPCSVKSASKPTSFIERAGQTMITKSISSKSVTLTAPASEKVEFYDYNNKFQKQYEPTLPTVIASDHSIGQLNAMDNANIERQVEKTREREIELLRKKSEERCREALEREKVKRDYELLQSKLEALLTDKHSSTILNKSHDDKFSEVHIKQISEKQNKRINNAIENMLQRPIVITCPEINNDKAPSYQDKRNVRIQNRSLNLASNFNDDQVASLNSSDSCCSILLSYVDEQEKRISDDINQCNSNEKTQSLKSILERINKIKDKLVKETNGKETILENEVLKKLMIALNDINEEYEDIVQKCQLKNDLVKREQQLKKQEAILDKKIKEFYKLSKNDKLENSLKCHKTDNEDTVLNLEPTRKQIIKSTNNPIEIIIKVNDKTPKKIKGPKSKGNQSPRVRSSLIDTMKCRKKFNSVKISTPLREENNSEVTTSTVYRSPPDAIRSNFDKVVETAESNLKSLKIKDKSSKNVQIEMKKMKKTPIKSKPSPVIKSTRILAQKQLMTDFSRNSKNNPILQHYIQRLLGMSRSSINMLGVSSSNVTTPNSSVMNTTANRADSDDSCQQQRFERLQRFIEDNYTFLSELEESLKSDKENSSNSMDTHEAWKKTLKSNQVITKPILKKFISKKKVIKSSEVSDKEKLDVLEKYTEMTETCGQRIAELTEMINRVRQEKQKILEITLSSNGEPNSEYGKNSTEYFDFASKKQQQQIQSADSRTYTINESAKANGKCTKVNENVDKSESTEPIAKNQESPLPVPEIEIIENIQLEKNKLTGISRDSGISLSRPVTALDSRDSPDIRRDTNNDNQMDFEPLLKDIPKPNQNNVLIQKTTQVSSTEIHVKRTTKPPVALSRFSPQLIEEMPHELSTIVEIETPGTSRNNIIIKSTDENARAVTQDEDQDEIFPNEDELNFRNFPSFDEFAKKYNLDTSHFSTEANAKIQEEFEKLLELSQCLKDYKEFPNISSFIKKDKKPEDNVVESDKEAEKTNSLDNIIDALNQTKMNFEKFPTAKEYFKNIEATDLITSQSLNDIAEFLLMSSSSESLPDVNAELMRRKVLKKPFESHIKTDKDANLNNISGIEKLSKSTSSKSSEIEKDLELMGMKWANRMLHKTQLSQAISSSSSSIIAREKTKSDIKLKDKNLPSSSKDLNLNFNSEQSSESSILSIPGKPINLREFLAQELRKHTNSSTTSSDLSDDSIASLFLKSLIGSLSNTPTSVKQRSDRSKQKTSTPVPANSSFSPVLPLKQSGKENSLDSTDSIKLFSGESRLSSVRLSSDGEKPEDECCEKT